MKMKCMGCLPGFGHNRPPRPRPKAYCRGYKRYKGVRWPRCHGGNGCYGCWKKYFDQNDDVGRDGR